MPRSPALHPIPYHEKIACQRGAATRTWLTGVSPVVLSVAVTGCVSFTGYKFFNPDCRSVMATDPLLASEST
jgi:hypothetical protein